MKIRYFGHAAVGLEAAGGLRVLLDPYLSGAFDGRMAYRPIPGKWDVIIISHDHLDHNHVGPELGKPTVVRAPGQVAGLDIRMLTASHGTNKGTMEGRTQVSRFVLDDLVIVHPGDLAPPVDDGLVANFGKPDILFLPVGGRFTFDPKEALEFLRRMSPRVAIPIHFKTAAVDLPLRPAKEFLDLCPLVRTFPNGEIELHTGSLPSRTQVWYLPPLLG